MRPIRPAILAVFVLIAAFAGSANAAHCRSGDRLVLGEWSDQVSPGRFDPHRPSWESEGQSATIAWGISCQDGDTTGFGRPLSGISILPVPSIVRRPQEPDIRERVTSDDFSFETLRAAPEPKPPRFTGR